MTTSTFRHPAAILMLAATASVSAIDPAMARSDEVFTETCGVLSSIKTFIYAACYVLAAIGIALLAISAATGRFKWGHALSLGGGIFILGLAPTVLEYLAGETFGDNNCTL